MSERKQPLAERVGARIERARRMRGHTLRSMADLLGGQYSHTTLQKYEKGIICPDIRTIGLIARALDLRTDYFVQDSGFKLEAVEYRKLSKLGKKAQKQIEEEAFEFFERYLEIESILSVLPEKLPNLNLNSESLESLGEAIEKAAVDLRMAWALGMNPIPNVHTMLEEHGIKVKILKDRDGFDGFSAIAQSDRKKLGTIALSRKSNHDAARLRFTALHELGHLILKLPELEPADKERACHQFAGAMLIPKSKFIEIFGRNRIKISVGELVAIKEEWGISCMATMARARNLGLISPGRYKTFCIEANKRKWRSDREYDSSGNLIAGEPGEWLGNEESGRFEQLVFRALSSDIITASKACGLLNWTPSKLAENYQLIES